MNIADLMVEITVKASPNDKLSEVVTTMRDTRSSCFMVCDGDSAVGIVTERDIVGLFAGCLSDNKLMLDVPVADVMTPNPYCVREKTTLYEALTIAREKRLRHLPVVDANERLVGIVTQADMANTYVQLMENQLELEAVNKELQNLSNEDALMKIGNRRAMEADLDYAESVSVRYKNIYAIALIDVDYFKKYNDHYGHQEGDEALKRIAQAIKVRIRKSDKVYRYGGEELLLLMPETDSDGSLTAVDQVRTSIEQLAMVNDESPFGVVTVSVGVVSRSEGKWRDMVEAADKALYQAKKDGRNLARVAQ